MDRFVSSCLKATFTQSISGDVLGLITSHQIWDFLETTFTTQFSSRRSMLRNEIQSIRIGNRYVEEYLQQIKSITDILAAFN